MRKGVRQLLVTAGPEITHTIKTIDVPTQPCRESLGSFMGKTWTDSWAVGGGLFDLISLSNFAFCP